MYDWIDRVRGTLPAHFLNRFSCTAALPAFIAALAFGACAPLAPEPPTITLKIAAINDFHGNLEQPAGNIRATTADEPRIPAGGVARLATLVERLRTQHSYFAFVSAGDLIGASPLVSRHFDDEPTIEAMNGMGLDFNGVGNHEFDRGIVELRRLQHGGCASDTCKSGTPFTGARFGFLAANVIVRATGQPLFPAYAIREYGGVKVAFIGVTLKNTPASVTPAGVAGLDFLDEADTVNRLVPQLRSQGVETMIVLIHQGGVNSGGPNDCVDFRGPIVELARRFDRAIDVVISGHTHQAYICHVDGRLVTSAGSFGRLLTDIDVRIDARSRDVVSATAVNQVVRTDVPENPLLAALAARYSQLAAPLDRAVGRITQSFSNIRNADGESALGQLIADAHLEATAAEGAVIAFMNPGGIRTPLDFRNDGTVRYTALVAAQPFRNTLVTMTLTGAQILDLLEQQWHENELRILQVSKGFSYTWDPAQVAGARIVRNSVTLHGKPLQPNANYRITVNSFLADGGDHFQILLEGRARTDGVTIQDALMAYLAKHSPLAPTEEKRLRRVMP